MFVRISIKLMLVLTKTVEANHPLLFISDNLRLIVELLVFS